MIDWQFILNPDSDNLEIDEPVGWADIAFEIIRDKKFHGISIAHSLSEVRLVGEGAVLLKTQFELNGVDADVKIRVIAICDDEEQDSEDFQLDFGRYKEKCGEECSFQIGIEDISCFAFFNSNFDKKVSLTSEVAFDGVTPLEEYEGIEKDVTLPGKALRFRNRAETTDTTENLADPPYFDDGTDIQSDTAILPAFQNTIEGSLGTFSPSPILDAVAHDDALNYPPYLTWEPLINTSELFGDINCAISDVNFTFRLKGSIDTVLNHTWGLSIRVDRLPAGGDAGTPGDWVREYQSADIAGGAGVSSGSWDEEITVPMEIEEGDFIYLYYEFVTTQQIDDVLFTQDSESYVNLEVKTLCDPSISKMFMVHETISRLAEYNTNNCLTLKSTYFGRTDSEPTAYDVNGCGGFEALTSGLYIRRAENPTFFLSMKDALEGLKNIHNIGFALQRESGVEILRVEEYDYFYQDFLLMDCSDLDVQTKAVVSEEIPGVILGGYEKWEVENINGLDEFNSKREYRLTLKNAKTTLDLRCRFIAGGYAIELTRLQSFADTGAADTKYDNDTFILCLEQDVYAYTYPYVYGGYVVEQGGITGASEMFDPDTVINFRISPIRNMMRLAKSIFGVYRIYTDSESKIVLSSGDGNILAEGWLSLDDCTPENQVISESDEIEDSIYNDTDDLLPKIRPESITFEYPMSLSDFKRIKANPYGYINHCDGSGFIQKVIYKPNDGKASFELRNKYD
jgi:hypothetical protein